MKAVSKFLVGLFAFAIFTACTIAPGNNSTGGNNDSGGSGGSGSIELNLAQNGVSKVLLPAISMDISNYTITLNGPGGSNIITNITATNLSLPGLQVGTWTIRVVGNNSNNTPIGMGTNTTTVVTSSTSVVLITVTPFNGLGSLNLTVNWNSVALSIPQLAGTLIPFSGPSYNLQFSTNSNSGVCITNNLPTGYYALITTLRDNSVLVAGAVDVVRIVSNQTTFGTFNFTNINAPGGVILINIIANMGNPIPVTLTGQTNTILTNQPMTVLASVPAGTGNVTYIWYINGIQQGISSNITVNITNAGYYRLDVIVFNVGGTRAGSATHSFNVVTSMSPGGPAPLDIGSTTNFAILAESGITASVPCAITGNIGVSPIASTAIVGFGLILDVSGQFALSSQVSGRVYAANYSNPTPVMLATAVSNMITAYTNAAALAPANFTNLGAGEIGGMNLSPGLYNWTTALSISSNLTLTGGPNDVWIFQVNGALTEAAGVNVILGGSAQPKNIFWQTSSTGLAASAHMEGILLSSTTITLGAGASVDGRLLAQTAVTLNSNTIIQP